MNHRTVRAACRRSLRAAGIVALPLALAGAVAACGGVEGSTSAQPRAKAAAAPALRSQSSLRPPKITVNTKAASSVAPGLVFIAPKAVFGAKKSPGDQTGPEIVDNQGRVRWFKPSKPGVGVTDFRMAELDGQPVITYWEGRILLGQGDGQCVVMNQRYEELYRVGTDTDIHECNLHDGRFWATKYENVARDLTSVGGKKKDKVVDGIIEGIDVKTGKVEFEWHSLGNVGLKESYEPISKRYGAVWDYIHVNSVDVDTDGNILVSARHTWTVYKIDVRTGDIMWRLGGKRSSFKQARDSRTSWQHDATSVGTNRVQIFDNAAGSEKVRDRSRIITMKLDPTKRTATMVRSIAHPDDISSGTQGNGQLLANGNTFVGWGSRGDFSEFDAKGKLLFSGEPAARFDSYRAYRADWVGAPTTKPAVAATRDGGTTRVFASWNGSTAVTRWKVLAGASADGLTEVKQADWNGLETGIAVPGEAAFVQVQALDPSGAVIGTSETVRRKG